MNLHTDDTTEQDFARIITTLRSARTDAELSQEALAFRLSVRGRAISEWETRIVQPTLEHLLHWSWELGHRLLILDRDGSPRRVHTRPRAGDPWEVFERRRLADPLRDRRVVLGLSQTSLGLLVGVSQYSIRRWELMHVPPQPVAHIVWARKLGCSVAVRPADADTMLT